MLVDEQLRIQNLNKERISGYEWEESNHLGVATQVANEKADVGVGSRKVFANCKRRLYSNHERTV